MENPEILALRRKIETIGPGETLIALSSETATAMLDKLDACKKEQARVNTENQELKSRPAGAALVASLQASIAVLEDTGRRLRAENDEARAQLREALTQSSNDLDALRQGIPANTNTLAPVPQDGKRYRVFFRSKVVEWESGPDVWVCSNSRFSDDGASYAYNADGWLPEPDTCWSCDDNQYAVEGSGGHCAKCMQWIGGGMDAASVVAGTRVRYYGCFGVDEHRTGTVRMAAAKNTNGLALAHVDLDDGNTIHGASIRHLAPEEPST
jgi:hypothetical protein